MKRTVSTIMVLTITVMVIASISLSIRTAKAQSGNYNIARVSHGVEVLSNGYIFINDTLEINGQAPNNFTIGFPYKYGPHVLRGLAYDAFNSSNTFPVTLNVPLDDHIGFYGARIDFPQGAPPAFTVDFVLSNDLLTQVATNTSLYTLDFPAYPSLTKQATLCNASIILPEAAYYLSGTVPAFTYGSANLTAFTYAPANISFLLSVDQILKIDVTELTRQITVTEFGEIDGIDMYHITSNMNVATGSMQVVLPPNATSLSAFDQFNRPFSQDPTVIDANTSRYKIFFTESLQANGSTIFKIKYALPSAFVTQEGTYDFNLNFPLFQHVNYYIDQASVTFVLPEGARVSGTQNAGNYAITRSAFLESVTLSRQGVLSLDSFNFGMTYSFNPLWVSFRPTLWMWALALVGSVVVFVWKRPKAPTKVTTQVLPMKLSSELLKSFVDAYDEKRRILAEIASLESRVQRGRIPRRRYKVQRITLETRLNTLSRNLMELKGRVRTAGGRYSELMLQLEVTESEINEVEANIKSAEALHNRGELSLEAYNRRLADYQRRRDKADTTISGILLRLREEIR
jgi:hypothetical protein